MNDGWHLAFYSQTIFQDKTVDSQYPLLNDGNYKGEVSVPVFPTAMAVYKRDNWAFSLGFGPNGGGGSATFNRGLPSFEIPISKVVPALSDLRQVDPSLAVTGYDANLSFEGSSVFWGIQLGATYKVNKVFSVFGGVRYLPSKNVYKGSIENIQLAVAGNKVPAAAFLTQTSGLVSGLATQAGAASVSLKGTAEMLQPFVDNGVGTYTLSQLEDNGILDAATCAQIAGGLKSIGFSQTQIDAMTVADVKGGFSSAASSYHEKSAQLQQSGTALNDAAASLGDKYVETTQTGAGYTPMIGINIAPNNDFNVALRYEMKTNLNLTNSTKVDDLGLFPDGEQARNDIPAILAAGVGYKANQWLETQVSYSLYFDKNVNWGPNVRDIAVWEDVDPTQIRQRQIDHNYWELALGLQFNVNKKFAVSVGGMRSAAGIAADYQSDFSYSNPSYTGALGFMWKVADRLTLDAGFSNTYYQDQSVNFTDPNVGGYTDIYGKTTTNYALGLSYSIF